MRSSTPLYVEVNGHFHFLAALLLGKKQQYSLNRSMVCYGASLDGLGMRKISSLCWELNRDPLFVQPEVKSL